MPTTTAKRARVRTGWTYADYCRIPADRKRHEIIDGRHYVTPAPETYHQALVLGVAVALRHASFDARRGEVYVSPIDVHLAPGTVVQPDVVAITTGNSGIIGPKKITGRPDLVVEVLSRGASASRRDRRLKHDRYERAGVPEYWIVDPETRVVEQHVLHGRRYRRALRATERIELAAFAGIAIDLRTIW